MPSTWPVLMWLIARTTISAPSPLPTHLPMPLIFMASLNRHQQETPPLATIPSAVPPLPAASMPVLHPAPPPTYNLFMAYKAQEQEL